MHLQLPGVALLGLLTQADGLPASEMRRDNFDVPPEYSANPTRAAAVKAAFARSWNGYYKYAFPHDSLKPISNRWDDDRSVTSQDVAPQLEAE